MMKSEGYNQNLAEMMERLTKPAEPPKPTTRVIPDVPAELSYSHRYVREHETLNSVRYEDEDGAVMAFYALKSELKQTFGSYPDQITITVTITKRGSGQKQA